MTLLLSLISLQSIYTNDQRNVAQETDDQAKKDTIAECNLRATEAIDLSKKHTRALETIMLNSQMTPEQKEKAALNLLTQDEKERFVVMTESQRYLFFMAKSPKLG